jgi:hypothetical protein
MSSTCHYPGLRVDELVAMAEAGHLFGPDICGPPHPGEILGRGALYELVEAEYDELNDRTIARFRPHIDPRARIRYHGGDADEPLIGGVDTAVANRDTIRGR